jgi:glycosyltransferase involved in cell wall biosynthesis
MLHSRSIERQANMSDANLEVDLDGDQPGVLATPLLSVVIPVFNERGTLEEVVNRVERLSFTKEILLIDDGSTDGTAALVEQLSRRPTVRPFYLGRNSGKGAAIREAFRHIRGEIVVIQDADLEYDPAEIEQLLAPIMAERADVVYGSRFGDGSQNVCNPTRRAANRVLTQLSNRLTGLRLSDMETCYKAMRREVVESLSIRENRFGVEPELTAKVARGRWRVVEVAISYQSRDYAAGKKIGFRDGLRALWCIVRYSFRD